MNNNTQDDTLGTIRFGVIGTGPISERFAQAGIKCKSFALTAVYSRELSRARAFAASYGAEHCYDDLDSFCRSPHIDAVYIGTPNSLHCPQATKALQAGKHVLCEKPLASNITEVNAMMETARKNGVVLLEILRPVSSSAYSVIKERIGELGAIRRVSVSYHQYSSRYDNYKNGIIENAFNPELSNAALMDIGCYCVQWLVGLFGSPKSVISRSIKLKTGFEGAGIFLAEYDGMIAQVSYSKITQGVAPSIIEGENGSIVLDHPVATRKITLVTRDGRETVWDIDRSEDNFLKVIEGFTRFIHSDAGLDAYHACSINAMKIMDTVREQQSIVFPADA